MRVVEPSWPSGYAFRGEYSETLYGRNPVHLYRMLLRQSVKQAIHLAQPIYGSWLELGCGPGALLPTLGCTAERVVGLDFGEDLVSDASVLTRYMCGASLVCLGDAHRLPFRQSSFDGVISLETFEHLDCEKALEEVARVLKPGGTLVFSVPVEVGSALFARQLVRYLIRLRDKHFYPMDYELADMMRMALFLGDKELYKQKRVASIEHHLYFSYRGLLDQAAKRYRLMKVRRSPIVVPGPWSFSVVCLLKRLPIVGGA